MLPLPGPGWLIIFTGLGLLATEFSWAKRLLRFARATLKRWTAWLGRQRIVVRRLVGLGCVAVVAGCVALYVWWQGVPSWVPVFG